MTGPDGSTFQVRAIAVRPGHDRQDAPRRTTSTPSTPRTRSCTRSAGSASSCSIAEGKPSRARGRSCGARRSSSRSTRSSTRRRRLALVLLPPQADGQAGDRGLPRARRRARRARRPLDETLTAPLVPGIGEIPPDEQRVDRPHDALAPLRVQLPTGAGREPGHGAHPRAWPDGSRRGTEPAGALERAKARLDTLDYYPEPVRIDRVRIRRRAVVLPHPRLPALPRLRLLADDPACGDADASDDLVTHELCHIWQGQHRAVARGLEARDDALRVESVRDRGAARRRRDEASAPVAGSDPSGLPSLVRGTRRPLRVPTFIACCGARLLSSLLALSAVAALASDGANATRTPVPTSSPSRRIPSRRS